MELESLKELAWFFCYQIIFRRIKYGLPDISLLRKEYLKGPTLVEYLIFLAILMFDKPHLTYDKLTNPSMSIGLILPVHGISLAIQWVNRRLVFRGVLNPYII